jgi:hypothetical protein
MRCDLDKIWILRVHAIWSANCLHYVFLIPTKKKECQPFLKKENLCLNNTMKKIILLFVVQFLSISYVHAASKKPQQTLKDGVIGIWKLKTFMRVTEDNTEIAWCTGVSGFFIYTAQGYMSVAINCNKDTPEDAPAHAYNNMLLYTATYKIDEDKKQVLHHVINSSYADFIEKDLPPRNAELTDKMLTLRGNSGKGNFRIVLEKQ